MNKRMLWILCLVVGNLCIGKSLNGQDCSAAMKDMKTVISVQNEKISFWVNYCIVDDSICFSIICDYTGNKTIYREDFMHIEESGSIADGDSSTYLLLYDDYFDEHVMNRKINFVSLNKQIKIPKSVDEFKYLVTFYEEKSLLDALIDNDLLDVEHSFLSGEHRTICYEYSPVLNDTGLKTITFELIINNSAIPLVVQEFKLINNVDGNNK